MSFRSVTIFWLNYGMKEFINNPSCSISLKQYTNKITDNCVRAPTTCFFVL